MSHTTELQRLEAGLRDALFLLASVDDAAERAELAAEIKDYREELAFLKREQEPPANVVAVDSRYAEFNRNRMVL